MKVDNRTRVFDKRVVQRYIRAGRVTKEEYAAWLTALPNTQENIMAATEGGDSDGYEGEEPDEDDDYDDDDDDDDSVAAAPRSEPAMAATSYVSSPPIAAAPTASDASSADDLVSDDGGDGS